MRKSELLTEPERLTCNVNRRNKPKLDPLRSAYMYVKCTLSIHKLESWTKHGVIVIDKGLNRKGKGLN